MKSGKVILNLSLLLLFFVGPLIAAWWLFANTKVWTGSTVNTGQLIQPTLNFAQLKLNNTNGTLLDVKPMRGHWVMLYLLPKANCDKECLDNLYKMRQVRTALGKNRERVQRLVVTFAEQSPPQLASLLSKEYVGTVQGVIAKNAGLQFFAHTPLPPIALQQGSLYLVDPLGNIMMAYQADFAPKNLLKDLGRLLSTSQIG